MSDYLTQMENALSAVNSLEYAEEYADAIGAVIGAKPEQIAKLKSRFASLPKFAAQFDLSIDFLRTGGQTPLIDSVIPVPFFGASDYFAQYAKGLSGLAGFEPTVVMVYPFVGNVGIAGLVANPGDIIFQYAQTNGGACWVRISCKNVPYASLVTSTISDRFTTTLLRQSVPNPSNLLQQNQVFEFVKTGLFGKQTSDSYTPLSFKKPEQMQSTLIDMPVMHRIDKETTVKTYIDTSVYPTTGVMQNVLNLSIFVQSSIKTSY